MKTIRMGIIGLAGIGKVHAGGTLRSKDATLAALCDIDPDVLEKAGIQYGIPKDRLFPDHRAMLDSGTVDAVSICTPNDCHYPIAMDAIARGIPFVLEKPVTLHAGEAFHLKAAADEAGVPHIVSFSYRYKAAARFARKLIRDGQIGEIRHVCCQYFQQWALDDDLELIWRFRKNRSGSGTLADLGSHVLDLVRFLAGDIMEVCAHAGTFTPYRTDPANGLPGAVDVDDFCHVMGTLRGGIPVTVATTRYAIGRGNWQRIEIYGTKGGLVYGLEDEDFLEICLGSVSARSKDYHRVAVPDEYRSDQMQAFFDTVNGRGDGLSATMTDGLANQRLLDAILASVDQRRWVRTGGAE